MSAKYQLLLKHIANLEDSLEDTNLIKLSKELLKRKIISKEFYDRFSSLDPDPDHLESDIMVRYLLQQVCERVREDGEVFDRLVRVLTRLGGEEMKVQCEDMKKELREIEGREGASGADKGGERGLVEQDVAGLVEALASGSHLWDAIGIALNLPKHKREDCGEGKENVNRLSNILTTWILGSCEGARPATLSSLREVLASETVGLGNIARDLSQIKVCAEKQSIVQQQEKFPSKLGIIFQTYNSEIAEDKSTLLEVRANCSDSECYQWCKDGEPLLDGANFSGVCNSILYVNKSSQSTEGKYSCCVSRDNETVCSDEISVSVVYPSEKKKLLKFYSLMEGEVPQDSWPPVGNSNFINLVLIEQKQKPMNTCDYYTIRGDMDDILVSKEVAEYEEVFREYREGALVLVEGRPGSGKTTLVHKLTRDWARGGKVLQGAKMVFLVTLRLLNASGKDKNMLDLLEIFYGKDFSKKIEHELQECKGEGACFILDGLDEYPIESKKNLVIHQLLFNNKILPHSMIIVASRPIATEKLKKTCKMRIEVVGFSRDQIYSYVSSYPFDRYSGNMVCDMNKFLDQHPNVLHMCYLPVHAAMICFLFTQLKGSIPHRETQIYEQFTIATLLRYKVSKGEQIQIKSLKDLCGEEKKLFNSVCKLAYDMIINSQQVVSKSDAKVSFINDSVFGLLTVESTSKYYGIEDYYAFHHLTFQEFLAAYFLLEAQLKLEATVGRNVLKFYGGLGGSDNPEFCQKIISPSFHNIPYAVQCAYESQCVELCDHIMEDGLTSLHGIINAADFIALGYVISNTTKLVERVVVRSSWWDDEGVRSLCSVVEKTKLSHIKSVFIDKANDKEIQALNSLLSQLPGIEKLDLFEVTLNKSKIGFLKELMLPCLKILKISLSNAFYSYPEELLKILAFGSQSLKKVYFLVPRDLMDNAVVWRKILNNAFHCQVVQDCNITWIHLYNTNEISSLTQMRLSRCTDIVLVNCCISDEVANALTTSLLNASILNRLVLDFNRISDSGAVALAGCLARCSVVKEVSIQCNFIGDSGATALADALVHCSSLRRLDLQGNSLGDKGAIEIVRTTKNLQSLDLYLHNINVTEEGIDRVLKHRASTNIEHMVFTSSWDSIGESGIESLRSALSCGNLPAIRLSANNISDFEQLVTGGMKSVKGLDIGEIKKAGVPSLCRIIESLPSLKYVQCNMENIKKSSKQFFCDHLKLCKFLSRFHLYKTEHDSILNLLKCCKNLHSLALIDSYIESGSIVKLFLNPSYVSNLHSLILDNCHLGPDGALALGKGLPHCRRLRCLDLTNNNITNKGAIAIADGLSSHNTLTELNLQENLIICYGIVAFFPVIRHNKLQYINFSHAVIFSAENGAAMVDAIQGDTLQKLDLKNSNVEKYIICLSSRLSQYKQLSVLNLSGNRIGFLYIRYLAEGLQGCTNLKVLNLNNSGIISFCVPALRAIMVHCKCLRQLGLRSSSIGLDGAADLVSVWKHKSPILLDLRDCFDRHHMLALQNSWECCDQCDHLLELYHRNDYVFIEIESGISIPKLVIP